MEKKINLRFLGIAAFAAIAMLVSVSCDTGTDPMPEINITTQPQDLVIEQINISPNTKLNTEATLTETEGLAYQWFRALDANGNAAESIPYATESSYTIQPGMAVGVYYYYCEISSYEVLVSTRVVKVEITGTTAGEFAEITNPVAWTEDWTRASFMVGSGKMYKNDVLQLMDINNSEAAAYMQANELMVPVEGAKAVFTTITVSSDTVTLTADGKTATVTAGSADMTGDVTATLSVTPEEKAGIIYLPLREIAAAFGLSAGWEPEAKVLTVVSGITVNDSGTIRTNGGNMNELPTERYGSPETIRIAENLLYYQRHNGGWQKDTEFNGSLSESDIAALQVARNNDDATLDNGTTMPHIQYLVKMYQATKNERYREAYLLAINGVLSAQYANGGFPQVMSRPANYAGDITFNDSAMTNVLRVWNDIYVNPNDYYSLGDGMKKSIEESMIKGLVCVLDCQIEAQGKLTGWCGQHDRNTLMPLWAREYEPPSISGAESVQVLTFLMDLKKDFLEDIDLWTRVRDAVHAGTQFFEDAQIVGYRYNTRGSIANGLGHLWGLRDGSYRSLVPDETVTGGVWARFYDYETLEPVFCDRPNPTFRPAGNTTVDGVPSPAESTWYGEINTGYRPTAAFPSGGNLRNVYDEEGNLDLPKSFANISDERQGGYAYIITNYNSVFGVYETWLRENNLTDPTPSDV